MAIAVQPFEGSYKLDGNHSSFQFSVTHLGLSTFRASFARHRRAARSPRRTARSRWSVTPAPIRSRSTIPIFRAHVVHGADFFEADAHPLIVFRSTSIELGDDRSVVVSGELEIRGVSRPVTASGNLFADDHRSIRSLSRRPRAQCDRGSSRLGDELAAASPRRRRRAGLGGRDQRRPGAGEGRRMRVLAISGSVRQGSYNTALLRAAAECSPDVEFVVWHGLTEIPPYDEDLDSLPRPRRSACFGRRSQGADAVLIATPEYNGSIPGALKNAFDWASRPFATNVTQEEASGRRRRQHRPVRRVRAQAELRKVLDRDRRRRARSGALGTSNAQRRSTPAGSSATRELRRALCAIVDDLVRRPMERAA